MAAGYIYFAETSSPYIKVGRFSARGTIAKKEAEYKRLDPGFKIRHAYACEDMQAEEKRVLNMLRLVGGTEFKGAGRECFSLSIESAVEAAAGLTTPTAQEALARRLIMGHVIAGMPVRELLAAAERAVAPDADDEEGAEPVEIYFSAMRALDKLGILLSSGGMSLGLDADTFATVIEPKKLVSQLPALKKLPITLLGLAVY